MHIKDIQIKELKIPFKVNFKHSSADRKVTQSILVTITSNNNVIGVGESCPREYVTGESVQSAIQFIQSIEHDIIQLNSFEKLEAWVENNVALIDDNPSAWCAVELALLDLIGREKGCTLEELLSISPLHSDYHYTAILGVSNFQTFQKQWHQYSKMQFTDYKIKLSGVIAEDLQKLEYINQNRMPNLRLRMDANNLWDSSIQGVSYLKNIQSNIFAIEEPLSPFDFKGMVELAQETNIKIILDESFLNISHFKYLDSSPSNFIINLRISKMGGLLRSLSIIQGASRRKIPIIIGAQVGETSILTRAALAAATYAGDALLAQEGAFGTLLLEHDVTNVPLMFSAKGILTPAKYLNCEVKGNQLSIHL